MAGALLAGVWKLKGERLKEVLADLRSTVGGGRRTKARFQLQPQSAPAEHFAGCLPVWEAERR